MMPAAVDAAAHLGLVGLALGKFLKRHPEAEYLADDLFSAGLEELVKAARRFDPDRGVTFGTYAVTNIAFTIARAWRRRDVVQLPSRSEGLTVTIVELDAPVGLDGDEGLPLLELFTSKEPAPSDRAAELELRRAVHEVVAGLPPRDRQVLTLRWGLGGEAPATLQRTGAAVGITKEGARFVEARALDRFSQAAEERGLAQLLQ